jgi:hypothetical protein
VRTLLIVCGFVVVMATSACTADSFAVPTSSKVAASPTAVFDLRASADVRAVRHGDLVCFYAGDTSGDRLVFPEGYSASQNLELRDSKGKVVATPGSAVGIAFSSARVTAPAKCGSSGRVRGVVRIEGLTG